MRGHRAYLDLGARTAQPTVRGRRDLEHEARVRLARDRMDQSALADLIRATPIRRKPAKATVTVWPGGRHPETGETLFERVVRARGRPWARPRVTALEAGSAERGLPDTDEPGMPL